MIADPPFVRILEQAKLCVEAEDYAGEAGIAGFRWRFTGNRNPRLEELPCGSIGMGDGDGSAGDALDVNAWETRRFLEIDLQIDTDLPVDDDEDNIQDEDPTKLALMGRIAAVAVRALMRNPNEGGTFYGIWCSGVVPLDIVPDPESTPDRGRLVRKVQIQYSVRTDDPNVLLAPGAI